jgi:diguanylate cyclase (GGDEF)-like protein/PAS domain S-box-containing protein
MKNAGLTKADVEQFLIKMPLLMRKSKGYDAFLMQLVKDISTLLRLEIGHYYTYVLTNNRLETSNIFHVNSSANFDKFIQVTKEFTFESGIGLPGTAWKEGKTAIFSNVFDSGNFPRAHADSNINIIGGIALPIFNEDQIQGVFEFYSQNEVSLADDAIALCDELAFHLGGLLGLFKANRDYQLILNAAGEGVYGLDLKGNTTFVNPAACEILGYQEEELIGKPMHFSVHHSYPDGSTYPIEKCPMYASFKMGKVHHVDNEVLWHKEGYAVPVRYTSTPIYENDVIQGAVVTFLDITREKQARDELEQLAHYDKLTGLPNRHSFTERLSQAVSRANRTDGKVGVMFIDLDNFKNINDTLGHEFGDSLLQYLASRLRGSIRASDYLARLGGDEFAAIFEGCQNPGYIAKLAQKVLDCTVDNVTIDRHVVQPTLSIGISVYPMGGKTVKELLKNADIAMYRAKERGKNAYEFYTEELNKKVKRIQRIEMHLSEAISRNELYLHYQPVFNVSNKKIETIEALIRWENDSLGKVSPVEFIPIAELTPLIESIGRWVFMTVIKEFASLSRLAEFSDTKLSINVSARQLSSRTFIKDIKQIFSNAIDPSRVVFELTETAVMSDIARATQILESLCELGFSVALDDFGTGYTSLLYLKNLPINYLKIDREFIRDILDDENDKAIVEAIITLSRSLGYTCVAEGVENNKQLQFLEEHQCDLFQGFLYAKPMLMKQLIKEYAGTGK